MPVGHEVLAAALDLVPGVAVGDAVVEVGHVAGRSVGVGEVGVGARNRDQEVVVDVQARPGVPGVVDDLGAAVVGSYLGSRGGSGSSYAEEFGGWRSDWFGGGGRGFWVG